MGLTTTVATSFRTECTDAETEHWDRLNTWQIAQGVLGGVGIMLELLVLSIIFAYNKDRSAFDPFPRPPVSPSWSPSCDARPRVLKTPGTLQIVCRLLSFLLSHSLSCPCPCPGRSAQRHCGVTPPTIIHAPDPAPALPAALTIARGQAVHMSSCLFYFTKEDCFYGRDRRPRPRRARMEPI